MSSSLLVQQASLMRLSGSKVDFFVEGGGRLVLRQELVEDLLSVRSKLHKGTAFMIA
jgi:hypothetical protein